eukprot:4166683-Amphidinium_carterae.1
MILFNSCKFAIATTAATTPAPLLLPRCTTERSRDSIRDIHDQLYFDRTRVIMEKARRTPLYRRNTTHVTKKDNHLHNRLHSMKKGTAKF